MANVIFLLIERCKSINMVKFQKVSLRLIDMFLKYDVYSLSVDGYVGVLVIK